MPGDGRKTSIFKKPVAGRVHVGSLNIKGDAQADLRNHGGPEKAVYHFPTDNYAQLAQIAAERAELFVPGAIGENISTTGHAEADVCIGDIYALGTARIQVAQPRTPCWKIDARFNFAGLTRAIAHAGISGWYYRVLEEGEVQVGDAWRLLKRNAEPFTLQRFWQIGWQTRPDLDELQRLIDTPGLTEHWQQRIRQRYLWLVEHAA